MKRAIALVLPFLFLVLIGLDLWFGVPFWYFVSGFVAIAVLIVLVDRQFRQRDYQRLEREKTLSFESFSSRLCVTDDFNFRRYQTIDVPKGTFQAEVILDAELEVIAGLRIMCERGHSFQEIDVTLTVDHGLLYIVDCEVVDSRHLQKTIQDFIGKRLRTPIFERLQDGTHGFGIVVEPGLGNGEYRFQSAANVVEASFVDKSAEE